MSDVHSKRLGQLVRARRKRLQMHTVADLAAAAQVSLRLVGDLETGRRNNFSEANKAAVENALAWQNGSIDDTLNGGDPIELDEAHIARVRGASLAASSSAGLFENLAHTALRLDLQKSDRRALTELLKTSKLKEETLEPLSGSPEVAQSLNALYRDSVAELRRIVERSDQQDGK